MPTATATNDCNDWGSAMNSDVATIGDAQALDGNYFSNGSTKTCDMQLPIYCLQP